MVDIGTNNKKTIRYTAGSTEFTTSKDLLPKKKLKILRKKQIVKEDEAKKNL